MLFFIHRGKVYTTIMSLVVFIQARYNDTAILPSVTFVSYVTEFLPPTSHILVFSRRTSTGEV